MVSEIKQNILCWKFLQVLLNLSLTLNLVEIAKILPAYRTVDIAILVYSVFWDKIESDLKTITQN